MRPNVLMLAALVAVATAAHANDGAEPRWSVFAGGSMGTFDTSDRGFGGELGGEIRLSKRLSLAARAQHLLATDTARHCDAEGNCPNANESFASAGVELRISTRRQAPLSGYLSTGLRIGCHDDNQKDFGLMHSLGAGLTVRLHSRLRLYAEGRASFLQGWGRAHGDMAWDVQPDVGVGLQFGF